MFKILKRFSEISSLVKQQTFIRLFPYNKLITWYDYIQMHSDLKFPMHVLEYERNKTLAIFMSSEILPALCISLVCLYVEADINAIDKGVSVLNWRHADEHVKITIRTCWHWARIFISMMSHAALPDDVRLLQLNVRYFYDRPLYTAAITVHALSNRETYAHRHKRGQLAWSSRSDHK